MNIQVLPLSTNTQPAEALLPGLHIASAPRRPARGRSSEGLLLFLELSGNLPLSPGQYREILSKLGERYYQTEGSAVTALRACAENLNRHLLERNLNAGSGSQGIGWLGMITLRENQLYLAYSGPLHTYCIHKEAIEHYYDAEVAARGLGIGRNTPLTFAHLTMEAGDTLLMSTHPAPSWNQVNFAPLRKQPLGDLYTQLQRMSGAHLQGLVLHAQPGNTLFNLIQAPPRATTSTARPMQPASSAVSHAPALQQSEPIPVSASQAVRQEALRPETSRIQPPYAAEKPAVAPTTSPDGTPAAKSGTQARRSARAEAARPNFSAGLRKAILSAGETAGGLEQRLQKGWRSLLNAALPEETAARIPSWVMLFMAVAIPLVIVTVSTVIYFQRGRASLYTQYYSEAVQAADLARSLSTPAEQVAAWQDVLNSLALAEQIRSDETTQSLRREAQQAFDQWEDVQRLSYQPAIVNGLPQRVQVTGLAATANALFLYNEQNGSALLATRTTRGYELDDGFQCQSGAASDLGRVIDIAAPSGATATNELLALAEDGHVFTCSNQRAPQSVDLAAPPGGWNSPQMLAENRGNLFILDPGANTVWVYWSNSYLLPPMRLFDSEPPPLQDIADMVAAGDELYLLHQDGHMTLCTVNSFGLAPTACTDPAPYVDSRPNRQDKPLLIASPFSQAAPSQPPSPSIYLLEPTNQAIYHFSLRLLTFQRQYRPDYEANVESWQLAQPVTAFTVSPDARIAFLAFENQVYYAALP